ncbi:MAG: arsenate reductase family protein [Thermonemataceae bacterium]
MMRIGEDTLILINDSTTQIGQMAFIYASTFAKCIQQTAVNEIASLSTDILTSLVERLQIQPCELLNCADPFFQKNLSKQMTTEEVAELLVAHPHLLKYPVALYNGQAVICQTATDIFKLLPIGTVAQI